MEQFILQLGIMSLQACVVICVVLAVRAIFAKVGIARKYISILWVLPYICMICPWKLEGDFGFWRQPRNATAQEFVRTLEATTTKMFVNSAAVSSSGSQISSHASSISSTLPGSISSVDMLQVLLAVAGVVWLIGMIGLLLYSADAHLKLHRKLICCMHVEENIYIADDIKVPFVLGIFKPRIYLPCGMSDMDKRYVVAHEKTHIRHMDPLKKTIAFGITCLHWFNPLAWAAFHLYSKDMEMACDEETVQQLGMEHRQSYATTLLSLATGKRLFLGAPLAFDEGNVKSRIKNIVKYKKTWKVLSVVAVAVIAVLAVGFMTKEAEYAPLAKVNDMNHPPKEMSSNAIIITLNGETKYFSGQGYFDEISDFLNDLEIKRIPNDRSRDQNREKDTVIEYGALRFCFYADYTAIWSDNDVKASFTYQVKNPEEVKAYLEDLFDGVYVRDANSSLATKEPEARELTMEELIELCQAGTETLGEVMQRIPFEEEASIYVNLDKATYDYEVALNYNYFCYLSHENKDYRLQLSYSKEDNTLWDIYLYYPAADDITLLYTNEPERYTVNKDILEFLDREYNIDDYFTCTLPEGTRLGDFKIYYNDVFHGCPILGEYEEPPHGSGTIAAWYLPGCILIGDNDEHNDRMQFENGKAVSVRWLGNHMGLSEKCELVEGCEMQALLYEAGFDLFTAAESEEYMQEHKLAEGELKTVSKYWYVFMGEEDSKYIYAVGLNQEYFTKEDVIKLARSVRSVRILN